MTPVLFALALFLIFVGGFLLRIGIKLLMVPRGRRLLAEAHSPKSVGKIIGGEVDAFKNGERDYAVAAGMAYNLKSGKLEPQGKLSREIIEPLI